MADAEVLAAGGVIVRDDGRVAVIHRPRYDDWSLPKGKLDDGESFEEGALREVEEETGLRCRLKGAIGDNGYRDRKDRTKLVRYFEMEPTEGEFTPNDEVDALVWLEPGEALDRLSYVDRKGRDKLVRWYRMDVAADPPPFAPNDEVDELRWVTPAEARDLVSYEHDRVLLATIV
jgi:8-oxo-dGTP pyrophosphatase MutT (NUDIX family)